MKFPLLISMMLLSSTSFAHDLWVAAPDTLPNRSVLNADLGYGDTYPNHGTLEAKRATLLNPLQLVGTKGQTTTLKLVGDNYRYASTAPLKSGTYHILASYKPTFWLKDANGKWWQDKHLGDMPTAPHCEQTQMFGKRLLVVGNAYDEITATVPVGQLLEIVPLSHPQTVQAGGVLPLQVWYQGKPLAGATITATSDTYLAKDPDSVKAHREIQAYSGKTDAEGRVNFVPLIEGEWKLRVEYKTKFDNPAICQHQNVYATLILPVGKQQAKVMKSSEHHHDHNHHDH